MKCLLPLLLALGAAHGWWRSDKVCYNDYNIGCFDKKAPFTNSWGYLPNSPRDLKVGFLLYTRRNRISFQKLLYRNRSSIRRSNFDGSRPTKIIVHGFRSKAPNEWSTAMKNEILKKVDANVILVDWSGGASTLIYRKAVANTRAVGAMIGEQIKSINAARGSRPGQFHLIGHSLGAHVSGYAGTRVRGIGRITGLDPAGPAFTGYDKAVKLDRSDANYVDVIHTDMDFLGSSDVLGHADFYPNGGEDQPGCILSRRRGAFGCSHGRAPEYFNSSINSCRFKAYPCSSWSAFKSGKCKSCGFGGCPVMGWGADQSPKAVGSFFLTTTRNKPYC